MPAHKYKDHAKDSGHQDDKLGDIVVGFTGTREGMTPTQKIAVAQMFRDASVIEAHHGDCIGGDEDFHNIAQIAGVRIEIHPPENTKLRAYCQGAAFVHPPRPYLVRNRVIVNSVQVMIACPKEEYEPLPSRGQGTWSTIRYARKCDVLLRIVWPE